MLDRRHSLHRSSVACLLRVGMFTFAPVHTIACHLARDITTTCMSRDLVGSRRTLHPNLGSCGTQRHYEASRYMSFQVFSLELGELSAYKIRRGWCSLTYKITLHFCANITQTTKSSSSHLPTIMSSERQEEPCMLSHFLCIHISDQPSLRSPRAVE